MWFLFVRLWPGNREDNLLGFESEISGCLYTAGKMVKKDDMTTLLLPGKSLKPVKQMGR